MRPVVVRAAEQRTRELAALLGEPGKGAGEAALTISLPVQAAHLRLELGNVHGPSNGERPPPAGAHPYGFVLESGCRDSNPGPPRPERGALTKLRYIPMRRVTG